MILSHSPGGSTPVEPIPLLAPETIAGLRGMAAGERWPKAKLSNLQLDLCEAERAVHVAQVAGDADAVSAAQWHRCETRGKLTAEQEYVGDVHLSTLAHAITFKPAEAAELQTKLWATPEVRAALLPVLQALLQPTVDWLRGEMNDLAARVADLEAATAAEVWR